MTTDRNPWATALAILAVGLLLCVSLRDALDVTPQERLRYEYEDRMSRNDRWLARLYVDDRSMEQTVVMLDPASVTLEHFRVGGRIRAEYLIEPSTELPNPLELHPGQQIALTSQTGSGRATVIYWGWEGPAPRVDLQLEAADIRELFRDQFEEGP